jgi:hypothetical protein
VRQEKHQDARRAERKPQGLAPVPTPALEDQAVQRGP